VSAFSRRVPTFQDVFPSSDASFVQPSEVGETVELTHPFLAAGARFRETQVETITGAVGVSTLFFPAVPDDRFWYVPFWFANHTDPATQETTFVMQEPNTGLFIRFWGSTNVELLNLLAANREIGTNRAILVPPRFTPVVEFSGMAAGAFGSSRLVRIEYPLAENPPPF